MIHTNMLISAVPYTQKWLGYVRTLAGLLLVSLVSLSYANDSAEQALWQAQNQQSGFFIETLTLQSSVVPLGQSAHINWSQGQVRVVGAGTAPAGFSQAQARLRAIGAARADALRLLAIAVDGIRISADTTVRDYVSERDVVRTQVEAFIRGAVFPSGGESFETFADGSIIVYVTAELSLLGEDALTGLLLPDFQATQQRANATPAPESVLLEALAGRQLRPQPLLSQASSSQGPYTGLIIDTGEEGIAASLAPEVHSDDGTLVYSIANVDAERLGRAGVATFFSSVDAAVADARVGDNPLIIRAVAVDGGVGAASGQTPRIRAADAQRILEANASTGFLEQGNVSIAGRGDRILSTGY